MQHVIPLNDTRPHDPTPECPCYPLLKPEPGTGTSVAVHNAWDGRERGERLLGVGAVGKEWAVVESGHKEDRR